MNVLITGGAGFIGSNLAAHWLELGYNIRILDNLSRPGTEKNVAWLESIENQNLAVLQKDIRDFDAVSQAMRNVDVVVHLAAQVAVTTSVTDPRIDFEINTTGTLNVLEALRQVNPEALLLYTSTNKVYGRMEEVSVVDTGSSYSFSDYPEGIPETLPTGFSLSLWVLQGCGGCLCTRLCPNLRSENGRVSNVVYLWDPPVWE